MEATNRLKDAAERGFYMAGRKSKSTTKKEHHLEPDAITIPGQRFALVSFVGPTLNQKNDLLGMKIRGVFDTLEDAEAHVKRIRRSGDTIMDIHFLEMYQWGLIPPDPELIKDHRYQEDFLQNILKDYEESQRSAKEIFDDRKTKIMKDGLNKHLLPNERLPPPPLDASGSKLAAMVSTEDPWMDRKKTEGQAEAPAEATAEAPAEATAEDKGIVSS